MKCLLVKSVSIPSYTFQNFPFEKVLVVEATNKIGFFTQGQCPQNNPPSKCTACKPHRA